MLPLNAKESNEFLFEQELVEIDTEGLPESHPGPLVSLIDKAPQSHVVRTSQRDLREQDRRGLLW